jgi:hypothetical protein
MADALPCPIDGCDLPLEHRWASSLWTCYEHYYSLRGGLRQWVVDLQGRLVAKTRRIQEMERELRDFEAAQQALLDQGIWVEKVPIRETIADPMGGYRFLVRRDRPDRNIDPASCPAGCGHPITQHTRIDGCLYSNDDMRGYCPCEVRP